MLVTKTYAALSKDELFIIMRARVDVFVVEQSCPYPELDDDDQQANTQHIFSLQNDQLLSYARCYEKNKHFSAFGRVLVAPSMRGKGLARELVKAAILCCQQCWPERNIYIGAQCYLIDFYKQFGFEIVGDAYLEDGIAHQDMQLKVT
ncbi:GNAT family N-acetyltransferase [Pseudoalteromonas mariniglutinosa]|uniref:GNAT family N-acetyltransferase n=1 Tax=Pseudoalteromonas mariniglutinosa TaxID=206042 RepID=UPI00384F59C0